LALTDLVRPWGFALISRSHELGSLMRYLLPIIFSCVVFTAALAASPQDQYDESVGYTIGYSMMVSKMAEECARIFPEYGPSIEDGLTRWKERNAAALQQIQAQWLAYVERDHKEANLPKELYERKVQSVAELGAKQVFEKLHGESSVFAREYCQNYASTTLRSTGLYLEAKLSKELASFRGCHANGFCPNLAKSSPP
jgi:hypothetical protein